MTEWLPFYFRGTKFDTKTQKKGKPFRALRGNTKIFFSASILLHSSFVTFTFSSRFKRKRGCFLRAVWLQEAIFYLRCTRKTQQSVSLIGLLQPVLLRESVRRVSRRGVDLLLQSQRAEGGTTKHNFTLCTQSHRSHRNAQHRLYLFMPIINPDIILCSFIFLPATTSHNKKIKILTHFENI